MKKLFFLGAMVVVFAFSTVSCKDPVKSSEKDILTFVVDGQSWVLNSAGTAWSNPTPLPKGTTSYPHTPSITVSAKADYTPKTQVDLINTVTFTVTAEDGTTKSYTAQAVVATQ